MSSVLDPTLHASHTLTHHCHSQHASYGRILAARLSSKVQPISDDYDSTTSFKKCVLAAAMTTQVPQLNQIACSLAVCTLFSLPACSCCLTCCHSLPMLHSCPPIYRGSPKRSAWEGWEQPMFKEEAEEENKGRVTPKEVEKRADSSSQLAPKRSLPVMDASPMDVHGGHARSPSSSQAGSRAGSRGGEGVGSGTLGGGPSSSEQREPPATAGYTSERDQMRSSTWAKTMALLRSKGGLSLGLPESWVALQGVLPGGAPPLQQQDQQQQGQSSQEGSLEPTPRGLSVLPSSRRAKGNLGKSSRWQESEKLAGQQQQPPPSSLPDASQLPAGTSADKSTAPAASGPHLPSLTRHERAMHLQQQQGQSSGHDQVMPSWAEPEPQEQQSVLPLGGWSRAGTPVQRPPVSSAGSAGSTGQRPHIPTLNLEQVRCWCDWLVGCVCVLVPHYLALRAPTSLA